MEMITALKLTFIIFLLLLWIYLVHVKHDISISKWLCNINIHSYKKKQLSLFKFKQCIYCNHIKEKYK